MRVKTLVYTTWPFLRQLLSAKSLNIHNLYRNNLYHNGIRQVLAFAKIIVLANLGLAISRLNSRLWSVFYFSLHFWPHVALHCRVFYNLLQTFLIKCYDFVGRYCEKCLVSIYICKRNEKKLLIERQNPKKFIRGLTFQRLFLQFLSSKR